MVCEKCITWIENYAINDILCKIKQIMQYVSKCYIFSFLPKYIKWIYGCVFFMHLHIWTLGNLKFDTFRDQVDGVTMTKPILPWDCPQALIIDHLYMGTLEWHETEVYCDKSQPTGTDNADYT